MSSTPELSVVISTHGREALWRRTLWAIARRPPPVPYELVVVDDGSGPEVLAELRAYSAIFPWTFVRWSREAFEEAAQIKFFFNNPACTGNVGVKHARAPHIVLQGNEVVVWEGCYERLWVDTQKVRAEGSHFMALSTTYDVPGHLLLRLDPMGTNLDGDLVRCCEEWPLQSPHYRSDVINYCSLTPKALWEAVGYQDERYCAGISAEDSDFVRRARTLPGFQTVISDGVSLHQNHGGRTKYQWPKPNVISRARFEEGCAINRVIYDQWDGTCRNPQTWPPGEFGVAEVLRNWR